MRYDVRSIATCLVLGAATVTIALIALASGSYQLSIDQVVSALLGGESGIVHTIVVEWRGPRVTAAIVFGLALGVGGAVFQSLMRNPLASPDVIGFTTGSYTGAIIVIIVIGGSYVTVGVGSVIGGLMTAALVYLLAYRRGVQGFRLIIVGIAVAAVLSSVNTWLILRAELEVAMTAATWGAGSLNGVTWNQVVLGGGFIAVLLLACVPLSRPLRQMELGDDSALAQGVRVEPARLALIVVGVALTAAVTAAAGPIAFVALAAPQIARRLAGTSGITLIPAAMMGALLLTAADYAAAHIAPMQLPVGVITVMIGGAYLGWLIYREARRQL